VSTAPGLVFESAAIRSVRKHQVDGPLHFVWRGISRTAKRTPSGVSWSRFVQ
jgi:hypothetical protein